MAPLAHVNASDVIKMRLLPLCPPVASRSAEQIKSLFCTSKGLLKCKKLISFVIGEASSMWHTVLHVKRR